MSKIFTRDRDFYRSFFSLMGLLVVQNLISYSVNLADNVMLGSFGQNELAGAATVNQIQFVWQQVILGLGEGLVVLASQYWGKKDTEHIRRFAGIALRVAIVGGILLTAVTSLFPEAILRMFTGDDAIIACGMEYLSILRFTYLIFAITNVLLATLRSVETVKVAFYVSISTLILNVGINYMLIFGNFGAPRMGIRGAAIGTLVARIAELCIVLFYLKFKDKKLAMDLRMLGYRERTMGQTFLKISMPVVVIQGLFGVSQALQTAILGHLDTNAIAANSAAATLFQFLKIIAIGSASATSVMIGKTVGSGNIGKVKEYSRTLQAIFLCVGLVICVGLNLLRIPILSFYSLNDDAMRLANQIVILLSFTAIGTAYQMPTIGGIIRGGGDTTFYLKLDLVSIWCIMYPLSFLAAFWWKLPTILVVLFINSDQVFKCLPAFIKVNRFNWIRRLTEGEIS